MRLSIRRTFFLLFSFVLLAFPAGATWSICVVNRRTGEVAVASATCIPRIDLEVGLPVVRVGQGVGAIQSAGWAPGLVIMFQQFPQGTTPAQILAMVKMAAPNAGNLQIGIAGMIGAPATFTGKKAGQAKGGVTGEVGDLAYAIQGNVLSGQNVYLAAEQALLSTPGDLSQKLIAAMEAAAAGGGDGRCSCNLFAPTSCGSPPPSFQKSAHVGFMILARIGDTDPTCLNGNDCAVNGNYFLNLDIKGRNAQPNSPDPVQQLRQRYDTWRGNRIGKPDALLSTATSVQSMPADGRTQRTVTVRLVDIDGTPLTTGGNNVVVTPVGGGSFLSTVGPVIDNGDGTYSFTVTAGTSPGTDLFDISADAGKVTAHLYPYPQIRLDPVQGLHVGYDQVSAAEAPRVPFVLHEPARAGAHYLVLASLNGTQPGSKLGDLALPLNAPFISVLGAGVDRARLPGTLGVLDDTGHAEGAFVTSTPTLVSLIGRRLDWTAVFFGDGTRSVSNPVGFDIVP
ncbi:MAG TPA: DUF1028 domain-containing protein [Planctomycetes bacterium]|nr:DUF1028 domain-containing protein [Planctomycetota bacterium]